MNKSNFDVLVLDGGGSKGVYTLGVLKELELKLGGKLYEHFDLIYGTSTGSIIGSLIALGYDIPTIEKLYFELIPEIMNAPTKSGKSLNLKNQSEKVFGDRKFDSFKTNIGIVALNYDTQFPLVFKSDINQAHGMKHSFKPGFGCTIAEAVQCSSSAFPIFEKKVITTENQGTITTIDGGYIANNATLFALVDAHKAFGKKEDEIRLLNVGVGDFVEKSMGWKTKILKWLLPIKFVERIMNASTNTNVIVSKLLFPNLKSLRISESYPEPEYGTNMIEMNKDKLSILVQLGRSSFAKFEKEVEDLFDLK